MSHEKLRTIEFHKIAKDATRNKCIATSNKCLTSSNKDATRTLGLCLFTRIT